MFDPDAPLTLYTNSDNSDASQCIEDINSNLDSNPMDEREYGLRSKEGLAMCELHSREGMVWISFIRAEPTHSKLGSKLLDFILEMAQKYRVKVGCVVWDDSPVEPALLYKWYYKHGFKEDKKHTERTGEIRLVWEPSMEESIMPLSVLIN